MVGGPSLTGVIGRCLVLIECGVLALVLASCGDDEPDRERPRVTASPSQLRSEPDGGDERPISVRVGVRVTDELTGVEPSRVAAFLPLRIQITNDGSGRARVRIAGVGSRTLARGDSAVVVSPGLEPGRYRVTGPAGSRTLRVRPGG